MPGGGRCPQHKRETWREQDSRRGSSTKRLYNYRWQQASKAYLAANPLCVKHLAKNETAASTEVDHINPHRGDLDLFRDRDNWQALCKSCHSTKTARENLRGRGGSKPTGVTV